MQNNCYRTALLALLAAFLMLQPASAQDLEELISEVGGEYGSQYITPLSNSLGADLNAGLYHTAKSGKGLFGVNVYFGLKVAGMMVNSTDQQFDLLFPTEVNLDYSILGETFNLRVPAQFEVTEAPTIFGERNAAVATANVQIDTTLIVSGQPTAVSIDTTITQELIGGLVNTRVAPLIIPHASIGSIMGTDLTVRWLPKISHPNYGAIKLTGVGVRHNVSRYLSTLPVDIAITGMYQKLESNAQVSGDFSADITSFAYGIIVSKQVTLLTVYGGLQREKTTVDYSYTFNGTDILDPIDVSFSHEARSKGRAVAGLTLSLGPLVTNADVAIGNERVASFGIGFGF